MIGSLQAWSAQYNVVGQWMYINAGSVRPMYGVVTQGRHDGYNQWVTSYKVDYWNPSGGGWVQVTNEAGSFTFTGNTNMHTQVWQRFSNPVTTQYVIFRPLSWHSHISMRAGLQAHY